MKNRTQKEWLKAFDDINEEIRLWQALRDLLTWVAMTASNDDTVKRNFPSAIVLLSNGVESVSDRHATLLQEFQKQRSGGETFLVQTTFPKRVRKGEKEKRRR